MGSGEDTSPCPSCGGSGTIYIIITEETKKDGNSGKKSKDTTLQDMQAAEAVTEAYHSSLAGAYPDGYAFVASGNEKFFVTAENNKSDHKITVYQMGTEISVENYDNSVKIDGKLLVVFSNRGESKTEISEYVEEKLTQSEHNDFVVTCRALNIRSGPGTSYKKLGTLNEGTIVEVLEITNGWAKIALSDGTTGYVAAHYLAKN